MPPGAWMGFPIHAFDPRSAEIGYRYDPKRASEAHDPISNLICQYIGYSGARIFFADLKNAAAGGCFFLSIYPDRSS